MIVLDAGVLIAHLDATDLHHERASALLHGAADEALVASPITLAEVLVGPARAGNVVAGRLRCTTWMCRACPCSKMRPCAWRC